MCFNAKSCLLSIILFTEFASLSQAVGQEASPEQPCRLYPQVDRTTEGVMYFGY